MYERLEGRGMARGPVAPEPNLDIRETIVRERQMAFFNPLSLSFQRGSLTGKLADIGASVDPSRQGVQGDGYAVYPVMKEGWKNSDFLAIEVDFSIPARDGQGDRTVPHVCIIREEYLERLAPAILALASYASDRAQALEQAAEERKQAEADVKAALTQKAREMGLQGLALEVTVASWVAAGRETVEQVLNA